MTTVTMNESQGSQAIQLLDAFWRAKTRILKSYQPGVCEFALTMTDTNPPLDIYVMVTQASGPKSEAVTIN